MLLSFERILETKTSAVMTEVIVLMVDLCNRIGTKSVAS